VAHKPAKDDDDDAEREVLKEPAETEETPEQDVSPALPEVTAQDDLDMEMPFDDPKTDTLVDDIVAKEGDEILAHMDNAVADSGLTVAKPKRHFWRRKGVWYTIIFLLLAGIAAAVAMPKSRYWVLNTASVRASTSVTVTDDLTHQPLKNVTVELSGVTGQTDTHGKAKLELLKLGPSKLKITKPGFAAYTRDLTVGWGSNPLGTIGLKAVGLQYTFIIKDMLTGKAVAGAEVTGGDASALSDQNGKAVLTLPGTSPEDMAAQVGAGGYRSEDVVVKGTAENDIPVSLITSRKTVYMSKQSGKYDVYSSDIDGQNKQVILPGSGLENANISIAVSPDGSRAAVVSTRDNERDADGYLLNTLSIVTIANGDDVIVAHADQIRLIDWQGSRLVFEQVSTGANTPATQRYSLISYDFAANTRLQLGAASKFSMVLTAQGKLYYAVSPTEGDSTSKAGLYRINADGNGKQTILEKDVWTVYRTDYNTLAAQLSDSWMAVNISNDSTTPISAPSAYVSRVYVDSPDDSGKSLWVDIRNGQGVLLRYDKPTGKDTAVLTQNGVANPVRWLTADTAIFRVVTGSETADYAVSTLGGGTAHKIADVVNTYGFTAGQ
jgi:hypothetical protein